MSLFTVVCGASGRYAFLDMAFQAIAYGPDELCLLTIDGPELLAYDAQTESPKWRLSFSKPLLGVLFVDTNALPGCQGSSPFRSQSTPHSAVVVDTDGRLHAVDLSLGQSLGQVEVTPLGAKPHAIASSMAGNVVALALDDRVIVWRSGERNEVAIRASALAFSNDGATLAVGTDKGELRTFYVAAPDLRAPLEQTFRSSVRGRISDLAQHPGGTWLVGTTEGLFAVGASETSRLEKIAIGVVRLALDGTGARLAVQRSDKGVIVYEWPKLSVAMRIEYTERPCCGLAFGPDNWIGVALDHGDANKIDVATSAVHRTDTHPTRTHRSWTLLVEGKKEILSAKEAEEIRRMKSNVEPEVKSSSGGFGGAGGRIGIGAMISIALLGLRVCVRASSSSSTSYSGYNYNIPTIPSPKTTRCDRECASERIERLRTECEVAGFSDCVDDTKKAAAALSSGKCAEAKAAMARIKLDDSMRSKSALAGLYQITAKMGVDEACTTSSDAVGGTPTKHSQLVRLTKSDLASTKAVTGTLELVGGIEKLPAWSPQAGESPRAVWAASDGTVFVVTTGGDQSSVIYRRKISRDKPVAVADAGASAGTNGWESQFHMRSAKAFHASFFGKSSSDVYVTIAEALIHFDGTKWTELRNPTGATPYAIANSGADIFLLGHVGEESGHQVYRPISIAKMLSASAPADGSMPSPRPGEKAVVDPWLKESTGLTVWDLAGSSTSLWAIADGPSGHPALAQRSTASNSVSWAIKTIATTTSTADAGGGDETGDTPAIRAIWASPSGDAVFAASDESVFRSSNGGATWVEQDSPSAISAFWGRSSSDLYGASMSGLLHYDGKKWLRTPYQEGGIDAISGTATDVYVIRRP